MTNISDYRLRKVEKNIDHINIEELMKISNALDCSVNDLAGLFNILNSFDKENISELDKYMLKNARKLIDELLNES